MIDFIKIDVSELAPPEPMSEILKSLATLGPKECLLVKHNRQPFPLYEKLSQAGWLFHCQQVKANHILIYIFKPIIQPELDTFILEQNRR